MCPRRTRFRLILVSGNVCGEICGDPRFEPCATSGIDLQEAARHSGRDQTELAFVSRSFFLVFLQLELERIDNNEVRLWTAAPTEGVSEA